MFKKSYITILFYFSTAAIAQNSGQNFSNSPYSNFGYGLDINSQYLQLGAGLNTRSTEYTYSQANPATAGNLQFTSLDFGFSASQGLIETNTKKRSFTSGGFQYLGLGYKVLHKDLYLIKKDSANKPYRKDLIKLKINGFSQISPITTIGYNFTSSYTTPIPATAANSGNGGLNLAQTGFGIKLNKYINLGYSIGYVFGNMREANLFSINDSLGYQIVADENLHDVRGTRHNFGVLTEFKLDSTYHTIGFNYGTFANMYQSNRRFTTSLFTSSLGGTYVGDTINNINQGFKSIDWPTFYGIGYTFRWRNAWALQFNYDVVNWASLNSSTNSGYQLTNRSTIAVGLLINPMDQKLKNKKKMAPQWRLNYSLCNTQNVFKISNNTQYQLVEHAYTLGVGIPMVRRYFDNTQIRSMVNLSLGYLQRGTTQYSLAAEKYVTAKVSFSLGDIWFQRRKFN